MDSSSFSLTNVAAAIGFFTILRTIFLFFYRIFRSHQETKTKQETKKMEKNRVVASASLDLSSLPRKLKHHVFPSFHGADVRRSFLSHILKEFRSKAIDLFIDNDIERSKSIGPELIDAIRGSRIAIVLLSKNYASSTWCLDELVEIIKCREELGQTVMVLFYEVDPTDVKKQTGDFGKVFRKTCQGITKDKIRRWKQALATVAKIAGYHSRNWDDEAQMIEKIATDVSNKLNMSTPSSDFNGLVGMEFHMMKMEPFLRLDLEEVRMVGILGPSGIGKTTIARYLFNRHSQDFQLSVFMKDIKKRYAVPACSDDYGVKLYLHEQFMSEIINQIGLKIQHLGIAKDRLQDKKVLVVLDDVNHLLQLEAMAKETRWFGPRSRILITTQDQKLLQAGGVNHIYKVDFPSSGEALQMFCMYAFGQKSPKNGFGELAREVTKLAGELPLGLRVMGSYFRGMSKQDWKKAVPRLKTRLDGEIESILRFSYDALCDEEKNLFLHIACFFNDESADMVECCLENSVSILDVTQGLRILVEKSLISLLYDGRIQMHNLLLQLGREIMRKQYVNEPGKRLFLDDARDINRVLSDDRANSSNVIGIDLMSSYDNKEDIVCPSERAFERLSNLQFLRINGNGTNPQSLNFVSRKLRYLSWEDFQIPCFPSGFHPNFLVKLDMQFSKLEKLWEGTQPLSNLKRMDLSFSESLKELPDLSTATNLCELNLSYCSSLMEIPSSIGNIANLQTLDLSRCSSLVELPSSIGNAINLNNLDLSYCSNLAELPSSIGNATNLQKLDLSFCSSLMELPSTIWNAIEELNLSHCLRLMELPSFTGNAINLRKLDLSHCSNMVQLPSSIGNAINLEYLNLSRWSNMVKLTSAIGKLINLQKLYLSYCYSLVELPTSVGNAINLQVLWLFNCTRLVKLPSSIGNLINLESLLLGACSSLVELPSSIGNAINLKWLDLSQCSSLVELPYSIGNATGLAQLDLSGCSSMVELPSSMKNLGRLWKLNLKGCTKLEVCLTNINLKSLKQLNLSYCSLLKCYPEPPRNIEGLKLSAITEVPSMMRLWPFLSTLDMSYSEMQELGPCISGISGLYRLILRGMQKLVSLPQLPYSLQHLDAEDCESLESLDCSSINSPYIRLNFVKCFKLNQEASDLIIHAPTCQYAVLPGGEVPVCFTYQAVGSSLAVMLNQKPSCTSVKFKACIIFANKDGYVFGDREDEEVYCNITSKQNALTACISNSKSLCPVLPEHLYTFKVEAMEVTSTELVFEFELRNFKETWEIKECGIFQL